MRNLISPISLERVVLRSLYFLCAAAWVLELENYGFEIIGRMGKHYSIRLIQLLPVNDTVAKHSWLDSYLMRQFRCMPCTDIY